MRQNNGRDENSVINSSFFSYKINLSIEHKYQIVVIKRKKTSTNKLITIKFDGTSVIT